MNAWVRWGIHQSCQSLWSAGPPPVSTTASRDASACDGEGLGMAAGAVMSLRVLSES